MSNYSEEVLKLASELTRMDPDNDQCLPLKPSSTGRCAYVLPTAGEIIKLRDEVSALRKRVSALEQDSHVREEDDDRRFLVLSIDDFCKIAEILRR